MSYVHEACLIKWLTQQNIRVCELCKSPFVLKEEFGSLTAVLKRNYDYLMADPKRIIKLGIYMLYLYLFGRRFIVTMKYFKTLLKKLFVVLSLGTLIGHAKGQSLSTATQKVVETVQR
jgi:hypothetical protein